MAMADDFYIIESTLALVKEVEDELRASKLDVREDIDSLDSDMLAKIARIIANISRILAVKKKDARVVELFEKAQGLETFLQAVLQAYEGNEALKQWLLKLHGRKTLARLNDDLENVVAGLEAWKSLLKERFGEIRQGNKHARDVPAHPNPERFFVKVKELIPGRTLFFSQPINSMQMKQQELRTVKELLTYDSRDPISGKRFFRSQDKGSAAGSGIMITNGHHRVHEIIRRYLIGKIHGDTLIEIKRDT